MVSLREVPALDFADEQLTEAIEEYGLPVGARAPKFALEDLDAKAPQGPVKIGRFALKGLDVANLMRSTAQFAAPGRTNDFRQLRRDRQVGERAVAVRVDGTLEPGEPVLFVGLGSNLLVRDGRIHGWLRMLWGKSLLLWSRSAEQALRRIAWLNDKYALDGRDAVSHTNFLWCLGLHDRPFPERPIFGKVRSMSLANAAGKRDLSGYLHTFAPKG